MKKTKSKALCAVAALLAALFVLACLAGFAACGGGEESDDDTTTTVPDTGGEHTHTYSSAVTKSATCTEKGVRTYTCSCGASYTEEIDINPNNHEYVETAVAATCASAERVTYTCIRCGHTTTATGDPATGNHAWDDGVTTATCEAAGITTYTCTVCGATKYEAAPATGHSWDSGVETTPATCTEDGVKTYTCANCGKTKTEDIEAPGHDLEISTASDATCTSGGSVTETCSRCGYMSYYLTDALGHELVGEYCTCTEAWTYTCSVCEKEVTIGDDTPIASATLIATDETSLNAAVAWSSTGDGAELSDVELTVKLDSSTLVCSGCGEEGSECACEDCIDCDECECGEACENCEGCEGVPTITLTGALTIGSDLTECPAYNEANAVELTLDLNGNTLSCDAANNHTIVVKSNATLTVIDGMGGGVVDAVADDCAALYSEGTVTLAGGLFTRSAEAGMEENGNGEDSYYTVYNSCGDMTIEDGATVFNAGNYSACLRSSGAAEEKSATLTINGGKVYGGKYSVRNGSFGTLTMTGGQIGGLRSSDDALPYRALNNYDEAIITGGKLLGGNGGAIDVDAGGHPDNCVEGVVIFNEDGDTNNSLTIGDEDGNGPEIVYEGVNAGTALRGDFAAGIALYSGTVNFLGGTISCDEVEYLPFVGAYLTDGTLNVSGGKISGIEAAIVVNAAEDGDPRVNISGGVLEGAEAIHNVTDADSATALDRVTVPSDSFTFNSGKFSGMTATVTETAGDDGTINITISDIVANQMSKEQGNAFDDNADWDGSTLRFYVGIQIAVQPGETLTYTLTKSGKTDTVYNDGEETIYCTILIELLPPSDSGADTWDEYSPTSGENYVNKTMTSKIEIEVTGANGETSSYLVSFVNALIPASAWSANGGN